MNNFVLTFCKTSGNEVAAQHYMELESTVLNPGAGKALVDERKNATFSSRELTHFLDGGKEYTEVTTNYYC